MPPSPCPAPRASPTGGTVGRWHCPILQLRKLRLTDTSHLLAAASGGSGIGTLACHVRLVLWEGQGDPRMPSDVASRSSWGTSCRCLEKSDPGGFLSTHGGCDSQASMAKRSPRGEAACGPALRDQRPSTNCEAEHHFLRRNQLWSARKVTAPLASTDGDLLGGRLLHPGPHSGSLTPTHSPTAVLIAAR